MDRATQKWKQQKIYLGLKANPEGIRLAEAKAREISGLLLQNAFDWLDYWKPTEVKPSLPTVADWVAKAKEEFFSDRDSPSLRRTWRGHHEMVYKHLPQDRELSEQILIDCLKLQGAETRSREIYYKALARLIKIAGFECDLSKYKGTYNPKNLTPRDIPSDEDIEQMILGIGNKQWRYVFAMMAIYGLRPHEVWHCELDLPKIYIDEDTKTGERMVFPMPERWIKLFEIADGVATKVTVQANSDYGDRTCKFARKNNLPVPYTFRHAYALRMIHAGVPDAIVAAWMGHTVDVHNKQYQRWLSDRDHQKVFESVKGY
jgi:integrase